MFLSGPAKISSKLIRPHLILLDDDVFHVFRRSDSNFQKPGSTDVPTDRRYPNRLE